MLYEVITVGAGARRARVLRLSQRARAVDCGRFAGGDQADGVPPVGRGEFRDSPRALPAENFARGRG